MNKNNVSETEYGYEIAWARTDNYCGKILVFDQVNRKMHLHFHRQKEKTWFVNAGSFRVQWVDTADGASYAKELVEGSVFHVPALMPVLLESLSNNSAMAEVSTVDDQQDYYRLTQC